MNNAIQDVNISARDLCEKLTKELGPMKTEREHRINDIIIEMAQSPVEKIPIFQCKYSLTGTFRTNNDYQIIFPLGLNMILEKEMTPTIKEYNIAAEWWGSNSREYDGTILKLVRKGDSQGHE